MCILKIYLFIYLEANYFTILWCFLPYMNMNQPWVYMCIPHPESPSHPPPHLILLGCPRALTLSALLHAWNLHWSSVLHMVIYMLQCYSLKLSHPRLLPQSPKACSLHLCLFRCLAYRIIITIFLNSIYMHWYTVLVFFFLAYFTLCNRFQFHPAH